MDSPLSRLARLKKLMKESALDLNGALDAFARERRSSSINDLLSCAALTRSFDRNVFDRVLVPASRLKERLSFEAFVGSPDVEAAPGESGRYRISAAVRDHFIRHWRSHPQEFVELHSKLAEYEQDRHPDDPMASLPHLIESDPARALKVFEETFDRADRQFDLAQCFRILSIVDARGTHLGAEWHATREQRKQRYWSRALFADAWYRTTTYYDRKTPLEKFESVLDDQTRWIFHLHATGGMGKTMFLRWLAARNLVPRGIPCAVVDFDDFRLDAVHTYPWLVLAPLAEQLDKQFSKPYLAGALNIVQPHMHLLQPRTSAATLVSDRSIDSDALRNSFVSRLSYALHESAADAIVLVFDTLEVVTAFPNTFKAIFGYLKRLHAAVPAVRVILAGRYSLESHVSCQCETLANEAVMFELSRFNTREAEDYLGTREISDADLRRAIVDKVSEPDHVDGKGGCNPFKLALLADLVLERERIKPADVHALPSADYQYLIERVIKRIPEQPLRWVVRYGVVPRRLTFDYIRDVMLDPLRRVLNGEDLGDQPQKWKDLPKKAKDIAKQDIWRREPVLDLSAAELWEQLMRYESGRGWISYAGRDGESRGAMHFHGDVVDPMRDLLSCQRIFGVLQNASARYFSKLADDALVDFQTEIDPRARRAHAERWTELTCEVVFHLFQAEDPRADVIWLDAVKSDALKFRPELRLRLALEPLGREYCESEQTPRKRRNGQLLSRATLGMAHLQAAKCILDNLLYSGPGSAVASFSELRRHKTLADKLLDSDGGISAEMHTRANIEHLQGVLDAASLLLDDNVRASITRLNDLQCTESDAFACVDLFSLLAHAEFGSSQALESLTMAIALVNEQLPEFPVWRLLFEAARNEFARGNFGPARTYLARSLSDALNRNDRDNSLAIAVSFFRREVTFGHLNSARRLIAIMGRLIGKNDPRIELFKAMLAQEAVEGSWESYKHLQDVVRRAKKENVRIDALVVAGQMSADLLSFTLASRQWTEATRWIERSGGSMLLSVVAVHQARARNRMGAHRDALTIASSAPTVANHRHYSLRQIEFQRAIALACSGQLERSAQVLEALLKHESDHHGEAARFENAISFLPERRSEQTHRLLEESLNVSLERQQYLPAYALTLGLALGVMPLSDENLLTLRDWLHTLYAPLRLRVLSGLRYCQGVLNVPKDWVDDVLRMLDVAPDFLTLPELPSTDDADKSGDEVEDGQCFARRLERFDVYRVFGATDRARAILLELSRQVDPLEAPLRALLLEEAWLRLGEIRPVEPLDWRAIVDKELGLLGSALLLHRAEALLAARDGDACTGSIVEAMLDAAKSGLESEPLPTSWDAKHFELKARLADFREDRKEAKRLLRIAAEMYRELGDAESQNRVMLHFSSTTRQFVSPRIAASELAGVLPQATRWPVGARVVLMPAGTEGRHLADEDAKFLSDITPGDGQTVSQRLAMSLAESGWRDLRRSFTDMLFRDARTMFEKNRSHPVLGLLVPQTFLSALPWELAAFPGEDPQHPEASHVQARALSRVRSASRRPMPETVRYVQHRLIAAGYEAVLTDGILGPVTTDAKQRFQAQHGLRVTGEIDSDFIATLGAAMPVKRPRVLIVQSSSAPDSVERTTYGSRGSRDLEQFYGHFADVRVAAASDADDVIEVIARFKPTLIHLVATVRETRGMVFIDFARRRGNSEGGSINATALDTLIRRHYVNQPRPFLVFDAVRPYSTLDAAYVLCWRNALASDLLHFGSFSGILATGLEHGDMLGNIAEVLLCGLERGCTMSMLASDIRALYQRTRHVKGPLSHSFESTDQDRALAYLGTALFAQDPDLPCLLF